ncbi:hypothetical protein D9611_014389 [Ephemerocybe angulata]|uniref:NAD(P)-binding domain-containing protein n=1 Tax=Ephemerocybe angulata TaxID=980116 RepID=A0A8H5BS39_9AGAR|nr:hypothetical protein D9611_014389 [Tulosesus angulatus]
MSGQTGQQLLQSLLSSSFYSRVGEYGRRTTALEKIPADLQDKLEQHTIDFEKLDTSGLNAKPWDVVFITLGTTRKNAGSAEKFVKIDREYVINAAKEAKVSDNQRLVYLSSAGANSSAPFLYPQSKGLTEEGLARLGYKDTIVFRPGFLAGTDRGETRVAESIFGLPFSLQQLAGNQHRHVGQGPRGGGQAGERQPPPAAGATKVTLKDGTSYTVIGNAGAIELAKLDL